MLLRGAHRHKSYPCSSTAEYLAMLTSTAGALIRAASPKLAQLAGSAVASYHAIYDVGNSTNIKWYV
jgi:hypothetical protein